MDIRVYSLNACRFLTGEEPVQVEASCSVTDSDGRFAEAEENVGWTMRFPSDTVASCTSSYGANMPGFMRVHGSKGVLNLGPAFSYQGISLKADIHGETPVEETNPAKDAAQFISEADHFADCIFGKKQPKTSGEEGRREMQYIAQTL